MRSNSVARRRRVSGSRARAPPEHLRGSRGVEHKHGATAPAPSSGAAATPTRTFACLNDRSRPTQYGTMSLGIRPKCARVPALWTNSRRLPSKSLTLAA